MQKQYPSKIRLPLILLTLLVAFGITQSASADLKQTNVFKAWDRKSLSMENGNVDIFWDGDHVWVYSVLDFDNDLYTTVGTDQSTCGSGYNTAWAGRLELGFYHTDNAPAGAAGFTHTADWDVVNCDFSGDGSYGNEDDVIDFNVSTPASLGVDFRVINPNVTVPCQPGNCQDETVTTIFVNLDSNPCDGNLDAGLPQNICFIAKAFTPTLDSGPPYWTGPLQGRFTIVGGGDKTVNFNPFGPNAITLENLTARSDYSAFLIFGGVLIVLVASLIIVAAWRMRQDRTAV